MSSSRPLRQLDLFLDSGVSVCSSLLLFGTNAAGLHSKSVGSLSALRGVTGGSGRRSAISGCLNSLSVVGPTTTCSSGSLPDSGSTSPMSPGCGATV